MTLANAVTKEARIFGALITLILISPLTLSECLQHQTPQAFFGDLHVHTRLSNDASGMGADFLPEDVYRYAKGQTVSAGGQQWRNPAAPLDFAAVTDHAEQLGAAGLCHTPGTESYESWTCKLERKAPRLGILAGMIANGLFGMDGHCIDGACEQAATQAWNDTIAAAESQNSPCEFTSFIAYEWTGNADSGGTIHRNVIFNQNPNIELPFDARSHKKPDQLFTALKTHCVNAMDGCDALTIPHNSNLSKAQMFPVFEESAGINPENWHYFDRLSEIIQHKGSSECYAGPGSNDEACTFENLPYSSFVGKFIPLLAKAPEDDSSYLRNALAEGLRFNTINPYAFGLIGSTDTHLGTAGQTLEKNYREHHNKQLNQAQANIPAQPQLNPGGLAVIYAKQNTRTALFEAMKQRHAYATSGHRTGLHFFAAADISKDLCRQSNALEQLHQQAKPMGSNLITRTAPMFYLSATKDPAEQRPGIQALQIIKVGVDSNGKSFEKIYDIAAAPKAKLESCHQASPRPVSLCAVWQDPEYSSQDKSAYYVRALEQPSCRWSGFICEQKGNQELEVCESQPRQVQERAWSSPIWVQSG